MDNIRSLYDDLCRAFGPDMQFYWSNRDGKCCLVTAHYFRRPREVHLERPQLTAMLLETVTAISGAESVTVEWTEKTDEIYGLVIERLPTAILTFHGTVLSSDQDSALRRTLGRKTMHLARRIEGRLVLDLFRRNDSWGDADTKSRPDLSPALLDYLRDVMRAREAWVRPVEIWDMINGEPVHGVAAWRITFIE